MKAQVSFPALHTAARALSVCAAPPRSSSHRPPVRLRGDGHVFTLSVTGDLSAEVDLPGALSDGSCAVAAQQLARALSAAKPSGKAAKTATATLEAATDGLAITVADRPAIFLDAEPAPAAPRPVTGIAAREIGVGPAVEWCDLITSVAAAAAHDSDRPVLAAVRLRRQPGAVLLVEATDRYRAHRGCWGEPEPTAVDLTINATAAQQTARLVAACAPYDQITLRVDDTHVHWDSGSVRVQLPQSGAEYPDLEPIRESVSTDADIHITVQRQTLADAVNVAAQLSSAARHDLIQIVTAARDGGIEVAVTTGSGAPLHRQPLTAARHTGPAHQLTFDARLLSQAVAFLRDDTVDIEAAASKLPVHLTGRDRHVLLMQKRVA